MKSIESMVPSLGAVLVAALASPVASSFATQPPAASEVVAKLLAQGYGGEWASFSEGEGLVVAASVAYEPEGAAMPVLERRVAMHRASLEAREAVAGFLEGASIASRSNFLSRLDAGSRDAGYEAILVDRFEEEITSAIAASLRFVEVEAAEDDGEGRCSVVVSLVPGRHEAAAFGEGFVETFAADDLVRGIRRSIEAGWSPPAGVRAVRDRSSSRNLWVVFASEAVVPGLPEATRRSAIAAAESEARRRADAAIVAAIRGESIETDDRIDGRFEATVREFNDRIAGISEAETKVWSRRRSEFESSMLRRGAVPPRRSEELIRTGDSDTEGLLITVLRVYESRPLATAEAGGSPRSTPRRPSRSDCGLGEPEPGSERVIAKGRGDTRSEAVKAALSDAVRQVNGALLVANESVTRRFDQFVEAMGESESVSTSSSAVSTENIAAFSNGMVRSYQVLTESPAGAVPFEIEICASVAVIEPGAPRTDGPPTVAVLEPSIDGACGADDRPCVEFSRAFASAMVSNLVRGRDYRVVDRSGLQAIDEERTLVVERVRRGEAAIEEILRVGRLLAADYLLLGSLSNLEHRVWKEPQPLRGSDEEKERLRVGLTVRMIEVGTGRVVWQGEYRKSWTRRDLAKIKDESRPAWAAAESAQALYEDLKNVEAARDE